MPRMRHQPGLPRLCNKTKADFLEKLNREHDGPFQGIGTMSELGRLVMSLVDGHAENYPDVADPHYAAVGIKR